MLIQVDSEAKEFLIKFTDLVLKIGGMNVLAYVNLLLDKTKYVSTLDVKPEEKEVITMQVE